MLYAQMVCACVYISPIVIATSRKLNFELLFLRKKITKTHYFHRENYQLLTGVGTALYWVISESLSVLPTKKLVHISS